MEFQSQLSPIRQKPADQVYARPSVLIAEDEPLLAEFMASVVQSNGFEAVIAETAMEFAEHLKRGAPDAIIMDLAMPDRDGVELMRLLAEVGYDGPILIISACDRRVIETSVMLGREMGLNIASAAQKPIADDHLREMLDQVRHELI